MRAWEYEVRITRVDALRCPERFTQTITYMRLRRPSRGRYASIIADIARQYARVGIVGVEILSEKER
jgi:hypothetical protein